MRYFFAVLLLGLACALYAVRAGLLEVPSRWNPWAPLALSEQPNWLTGFKLQRVSSDPVLCKAVLGTSALRYTEVADRDAGESCGWQDAVRVSAAPTAFSSPTTLTCRSAVSLAMWDLHVVQPAAQRHFGQRVTGIDHFGSYACRNVRGSRAEGGRRSQHATANALDIAGFRLASGKRIRVAQDWAGDDEEASFLHEVHEGACRFFNGVLGPEYNALHHDHFHLDRGPYRICR